MNAVINVVRAEAFKVARKRRLYLLAGLYWVIAPLIALIVARVLFTNLSGSFIDDQVSVVQAIRSFASPHGLATFLLSVPSYVSPTFYMVAIALITALLIGEERGQNMWKTVLVVQPNRLAVLGGKLIVAMGAVGVLMLGALVSALLFGAVGTLFLPTDFSGTWGNVLGLYALQWALTLAPIALAFLLVFLVRSAVLGIVMVLFLPGLIETIYTILNTIGQLQPLNRFNAIFQALRLQQAWEAMPRYFFTTNLYGPARAPLGGVAQELFTAGGGSAQDMGPFAALLGGGLSIQHNTLVMAGYAAVFLALLTLAFLRRDVD
ncbi:MAG: ABC transporter permease [Trueperaceae bacterium]|nr:ABC transporter permease [Trueperaceae bacterium]